MKILSIHLENLLSYAICKGILVATEWKLLTKQTQVDVEKYLEIYREIYFISNDAYFGLHFGAYLNIEALGSVYQVSMACSTIGQVIQLWSAYSDVNFPLVQFKTSKRKGIFNLTIVCDLEERKLRQQILDTIFTFVFRELCLLIGKEKFNLQLPYSNILEYKKWYNTSITTKRKHQFIFDATILESEINPKRKKDLELLLPNFLKILSHSKKGNQAFSMLVRNMILNMSSPELPTLEKVASQFAMTPRTLQRKLEKEKTSFRKTCNEIKKELYFYIQKGKKIKTQDMAFLLGYASSSAYLHAVQSWEK